MLSGGEAVVSCRFHPCAGGRQGVKSPRIAGLHNREMCGQLVRVCFPVHRPDVCAVALLRCSGLELELLADPRPLGLPLPDAIQHPLLAARGLPLRPHLPAGHHRFSDPPAVCAGGRHNSEWQHALHPTELTWLWGRPSPNTPSGCWCLDQAPGKPATLPPQLGFALHLPTRAGCTLGGLQTPFLPGIRWQSVCLPDICIFPTKSISGH